MIDAVLQPVAVVEPFPGDRGREQRPVGLGVDPRAQAVAHQALAQVEVLGLADLEVGRARDRRARLDEVGRVELLGAVLALVAARPRIAAVRTGPLDVAIGQEAPVGGRVDLLLRHLRDQPGVGQPAGEMLGQRVVLRARRAAEMVEATAGSRRRAPSAPPRAARNRPRPARPPPAAASSAGVPCSSVAQMKQHLVAARAHVAGIDVGRQLAAHQVAEVLDPVDIGQRGGDQDAGHAAPSASALPR